jgi:predicted permease
MVPLSVDATYEAGGPAVLARLSPGVTANEAQSELDVLHSQMVNAGLADNEWIPSLTRLTDMGDRKVRTGLWVLLAAVGFVTLIACANLANMLLARGATRGHEFGIRAALGAGRLRLTRQLMTESMVLSMLGGAVGLLLAIWAVDAVVGIVSDDLVELRNARLEMVVLGYTLGLSVVTGLLFGLAPAMQIGSQDVNEKLKQGTRTSTGGSDRSILRQALITAEVALALVMLLGAGLMVNSFVRLYKVDPGFEPANLVSMALSLPEERYPDAPLRSVFFQDVADRLAQLPDVKDVAWGNAVPPRLPGLFGTIEVAGLESGSTEGSPLHTGNWVSADYFKTIGEPIKQGREPNGAIDASRPVVVNESFARRYWPAGEAIGKRFRLSSVFRSESSESAGDWRTIVGVTNDVKAFWLGDDPDRLQMYFPFDERAPAEAVVIVRTEGDPRPLIKTLKEQVWAVDPSLPVDEVTFVNEAMSRTIARPRFNATLLASFAAIALFLAVIGVYGVISLSVTQRRREIGVRVALGAQRRDIIRLIVGNGVKPILIGAVIGLAASLALSRVLQSLLFEVRPTDPATYAAAAVMLTVVGALACYVPSRRATAVDPVEVLRQE